MLASAHAPTAGHRRPPRRWRRGAGLALATGLVLSLAPGVAGAAPTGCPPGIDDPGPVRLEDAIALERVQAGIAEDPDYLARLQAGFEAIDVNGDDVLCLKAVSKLRGASADQLASYYQAVDNKHPNK